MKELETFRKFLNEDREEFGQESIDKLHDTIASMGNDEAHQKALDMVDDGIFFPEEGTSPPNNVTLGYVEDLNYAKNQGDEEDVEEAQLFLSAAIIIKNAVKKTGPISYGEMGQSYNYYVKGDDLFTQSRETFEIPKDELEESEEVKEGYTPNEDEMRDAKAFIRELNEYIKTAENYINGEFDEEDMNIPSLIDGLRDRIKDMTYNFPSYGGFAEE